MGSGYRLPDLFEMPFPDYRQSNFGATLALGKMLQRTRLLHLFRLRLVVDYRSCRVGHLINQRKLRI